MAATNSDQASSDNTELVSLMRELVMLAHQQAAMDASSPVATGPAMQTTGQPETNPAPVDGTAAMQYAHSAARYNEAMSQVAADKQLEYVKQTQDRWHLMMKQLKAISE